MELLYGTRSSGQMLDSIKWKLTRFMISLKDLMSLVMKMVFNLFRNLRELRSVYKCLNVSDVHHKLFHIENPMGDFMEDFEEMCKYFATESFKLVEAEREGNEAEKVTLETNLQDALFGTPDDMQQTFLYSDIFRQGKPNKPDSVATQKKNSINVGENKVGIKNIIESCTDVQGY